METTDLHTILRFPTCIFYAQGVKASVLFFDHNPASRDAWTKEIWVYDYRSNNHHTLKKNPLKFEDLRDFITCYNPKNRHKRTETWHPETNPEGRWRRFSFAEIVERDKTSLDIAWIKNNSLTGLDNLPDPEFNFCNFSSGIKRVISGKDEVTAMLPFQNSGPGEGCNFFQLYRGMESLNPLLFSSTSRLGS